MTILVVGLAVVDFLFEIDQMPSRPEKYVATDAQVVGGGGAANAAAAIARLQGNAVLAARVGDDLFAQMIVAELEGQGVDCSLVQKTAGGKSSYSSVLIDKAGERQIVNFRGSNLADDVCGFDHLTVDAVLADTRWKTATLAGLTLARRLGVPGVLDGEAPVLPEAVSLASHVAFSSQGLSDYTGITDLPQALIVAAEQNSGFVCVTDGANGVYYCCDGEVHNLAAPAVEVVDTLGAGDVWHGAFTLLLSQGADEVEAMRFANAAASLKCLRSGGGRNAPELAEVNAFMNSQV